MIIEKGEANIKDWVKEAGMSGRAQSELIAAFRGADADDSPQVKRVVRWIRFMCIKLNNPKSHFMRDHEFISIKTMVEQDSWEWDRLKCHFYDHLKQALEIIAYYHPDEWHSARALQAFHDLNEHESTIPETKLELIARLKDEFPIAKGDWVMKDWVLDLPGKMQSALLCGLRGSDISTEDEVRRVTRWIRWVVMDNVMPSSHYMADRDFMRIKDMYEEHPSSWGNLPIHFRHHMIEALEVIGFNHPDKDIRERALEAYKDLCKKSKSTPESKDMFTKRMQDDPGRTFEPVQQRTDLPVG